ncbi:MAG: Txe/YoeB family addiction module toxin [Deinococcus sp.]
MNISITPHSWEDYLWLQTNEPKLLRKVHRLLDGCTRTPFEDSGKPEPLRQEYAGFWSRRINNEHRLNSSFDPEVITVIACRSHYE